MEYLQDGAVPGVTSGLRFVGRDRELGMVVELCWVWLVESNNRWRVQRGCKRPPTCRGNRDCLIKASLQRQGKQRVDEASAKELQ